MKRKTAGTRWGSGCRNAMQLRYSFAGSGSATRIRPQYSQMMIFLPWRMSAWRWGGMRLKQPPQASR